jgi:hypothetical protein
MPDGHDMPDLPLRRQTPQGRRFHVKLPQDWVGWVYATLAFGSLAVCIVIACYLIYFVLFHLG